MKKYLFAAVLFLGFAVIANAQLRVSLNIAPHPDPYLYYWSQNRYEVIATVTSSGKPVDVKFYCTVTMDGALQANTKTESMQIISIPGGPSQYYGYDLFPFDAVKFSGNADKTAAKTGMLAAGTYEFCVSLLDPATGQQLTAPVCKTFTITSYKAPVLLQPQDKSMLGKTNRPMFRWTGVSPMPATPPSYRVVVLEVLKGQTPTTAFQSNQPILDRTTTATQLLWPSDVELPHEGMEYVAGVIATDNQGNTIGEPNGLGGPNAFFACCTGGDNSDNNNGQSSSGGTNGDNTNGNNGNNGTTGNNGTNGNGSTSGGVGGAAGTTGSGGIGGTGNSSGTNGT
ncbi:MAG TPA: hypothetical protein VFJ29_07855, partial [Candidatus Kapabacteria bacterium]|nr:hypothetical protein [Candidatus Kapabacteria bacterium]